MEYKCGECENTFEGGLTPEGLAKQFDKNFPGWDIKDTASICYNCYKKTYAKYEGS